MDQVLTMTETETVELKKSLAELKQGLISLAAMLNKHGQAELWFGIAPNGKAVGLEINEKTLRDVSQAITAHIEPAIYPHITQQCIDGKHCLQIKAEGWQQPYLALENAPSTSFDEIGGLFITRFNRPSALDASQDAPAIRPETSLKTTQELPQATQETTQELPRTTQEILLQHLRSQPGITTVELARVTGLSPDGVKYHLNQLKRTGKLRRHGPTKGGYWEVVTKADE